MSVSFRALLPGDLSLNESAVCIGVILKADAFQAARMTYDAIVMDLFSALVYLCGPLSDLSVSDFAPTTISVLWK